MKLYDINVKLGKFNQKINKIKKIKSGQSLFVVNFNKDDKQEQIRKALRSCFKRIKQSKLESVSLLMDSFAGYVDFNFFSKVVAQELFRYAKTNKNKNLKKIFFITNSSINYKMLEKNIISYLEHIKINRGPFLTVDGIILYKKGLVLIKRKNPPLGWALPGGFVDYGENVEEAVRREVKEETKLEFKNIKQFKVYSKTDRDPRFHTVSVVFFGKGKGILKAASDAKQAAVFKIKDKRDLSWLPADIAFDHRRIIRDYLK